jgi:hypothetical protein
MGYKLSIAEILEEAAKKKAKKDKVDYLKQHNSLPLRNILVLMYDKTKNFNIPDTVPPYTPSEFPDNQGALFNQARKLKYFVEGFAPENVHRIKREQIFIEMLESVDKKDAELLIQMIQKKPIKGLTKAVINEAFGDIIQDG